MLKRFGVVLSLSTLLLLILVLNKFGVLAPDIKPEIYLAPWREAEALSRAWRESPKLGEPNFNVGLFPVAAVVGALQSLGLDANLSMRLLRWLLVLLGAWGSSRLYDVVAGDKARRMGRVAIAVLYVANPYMVVSGDFLANYLSASLLPWLALFLLQAATRGGWRYPAAAALMFAGMSGMNAAVIPLIQLLCLPALLWFAHAGLGASWRTVITASAKWLLLVLLISAYWLVPSVAALGAGGHVTQFSETLGGIAAPSSFAEVIRGVGLWTLYGRDVDGAWQPGFSSYLTNPVVVGASFILPILMVLAATVVRGQSRRFALVLLVPAAILMVGVHQVGNPTPFGHLLLWAFENIPGAAAFRTTHKVGAVLVLGMVLLVALAIPLIRPRPQTWARPLFGAGVAGGLVLATWPAWTGGLYSLPLPVPDYWYAATEAIDKGSMDQRVWFVPGVAQPQYTWSEDRPDDLNNALLERTSFVRITLPESSPFGASLLAALDTKMQEESLPVGALTSAARYLGVGDILVRHDVRWDKNGGARPMSVALAVGAEPDLEFQDSAGAPGEGLALTPNQPELELTLPPLQWYSVNDARDMVRTESTEGLVLVDGDGWALPALAHAGLLPSEPPFLYTGTLHKDQLGAQLGPESRVVLTDTNRRREVVPNRLTDAYGPLLSADRKVERSISLMRADDQTVLRVEGAEVSASSVGSGFNADAGASAENAFDGDSRTSWRFGAFGQGLGQWVSATAPRPLSAEEIELDIPPTAGQRIAEVQLEADGEVQTLQVPDDGRVTARFPGHRATQFTLTVTKVEGEGDNLLQVASIDVPGLDVRRVARLPVATVERLGGLDAHARQALNRTPLDVVFTRSFGRPVSDDDEEARLDRDFLLPDARDYRVYGMVRPDPSASDETLDAMQGVSGNVTVTSSSRAHDAPSVRASRAFDGDPFTGWSPGRAVVGEWLDVTFHEPVALDEIVIEQPADSSAWVSEVVIDVNGEQLARAQLQPGRQAVPLPVSTATTVRIQVSAFEGHGTPTFIHVEAGGAALTTNSTEAADRCVPIATVNGSTLRARIIGGVEGEAPRAFAGCRALPLGAGGHELRSVPGWAIDTLVLRDSTGEIALPGQPGPSLVVDKRSPSSYRVAASAAAGPYFLVVGQNVHPGWRLMMDGTDLGEPSVVDGYALGWRIEDLRPHVFDIEYAPQQASDIALAISAGSALMTIALVALPRFRRRESDIGLAMDGSEDGRMRRPGAAGQRHVVSWLVLLLGCWVFAGIPGLLSGGIIGVWILVRAPQPRTLLRLSVLAMSLAPLAWVLGNLDRWGEIGPALVTENSAPSVFVIASLVLLIIGSWRDDLQERD